MRLLIVEDDQKLSDSLQRFFNSEGFQVRCAPDGLNGWETAAVDSYDLIILDINLPKMNGLELLSKLRAEKIATPVILLTARGGIDDRVHGLNAGADDYLGKPFSPAELLARVRALLRRNAGLSSEKIILGAVTLDIRGRVVFRDGQEVSLTPREYGILELLAFNLNRVVSRLTIAEHVWDDNFDLMTNVVDVHIRNLRKKLNDDGSLIRSVRGLGYTIREQNDGLG